MCSAWGCCQEGGEGDLGSAPREYVGFLIAALGDGSLLPPSAALNAQLLPCFFFIPLPMSAADSFGGQGATHMSALRKGSGSVCAELLWTLSLPGEAVGSLQRGESISSGPSSSSFPIFHGTHNLHRPCVYSPVHS